MLSNDLKYIMEQIKSRIVLSDYVKRDVNLVKKGREFVGNCPFHLEKTASFFINDELGSFYCFGCTVSGDIFTYLIKKEGITFYQALVKLADLTNIKLPEKSHAKYTELYEINKLTLEYFKDKLSLAKDYCEKRSLSSDILNTFQIGFAPENNDLYQYLVQHDCNDTDIIKSGLCIQKYNKYHSRFYSRLIIPIFDLKNRVIAFGGRTITNDVSKYINSPESDIFHKKLTVFALNIALNHVSTNKPFIVVEGYMDVIMMHQYGFNTTVASMGTALSSEHLLQLWRYISEPIICFDGDAAGFKASRRAAHLALNLLKPGKSIKICILPNNYDPDSYLQQYGSDAMQNCLNSSFKLIEFLWQEYKENFNQIEKTPEQIALWEQNIFNELDKIPDSKIKSLYKSEFNNRIFNLRIVHKPRIKKNICINNNEPRLNEYLLLYIIIMKPDIVQFVIEKLFGVYFSTKQLNDFKESVLEYGKIDYEKYSDIIRSIKSKCERSYKINEYSNEELVTNWNYIFDRVCSVPKEQHEISEAVQECDSNMTEKTWQRLQALKMYSLSKRRNKDER